MSTDRNSYLSIIKAISLFGGVKIFQILISVVRSKIIAVLIGPVGMGIESLLVSTTNMVSSITGCGLQTSGVRTISNSYALNDDNRININVSVLRKVVWVTGVLGSILTFIFSEFLSRLAFGNDDNSTAFKIIAIILLFNQLNVGQTVLLQGTFHYKYLAKSSLLGNIIALLFTFPLYFFFKSNGIVPAIIISSVITLFFSWYYSNKISFKKVTLSLRESYNEGKEMIILGFVLAAVGLISQLSGYLVNLVISHLGNVADVGLYAAGYKIANTYVFLVLSSMSTDYIPRLSAISSDNTKLSDVINKQAILLASLIIPLIITFIVLIKEIVILLYSNEFLPIVGMIEWIMFGMLFRAISWVISYAFVAKGSSKMFFLNELIISVVYLVFSTYGYIWFGFTGLGIAFIVTYVVYTVLLVFLSYKQFLFSFSGEFFRVIIPQLVICVFCVILTKLIGYSFYRYIIGIILLLVSVYMTYTTLEKLIGFKFLSSRFTKNKLHDKNDNLL